MSFTDFQTADLNLNRIRSPEHDDV